MSRGCKPPGCSPLPGALCFPGSSPILTDTCHGQPHNLQLPKKGMGWGWGGQYHNLCFTKEKTEAHSSQLPGRSLCRRHAHTPPGSPGVSLTGPVCLTPSIWFLHSQWFSPTSFFRGLTLGFQNLYIQTPNPGDPEELRC